MGNLSAGCSGPVILSEPRRKHLAPENPEGSSAPPAFRSAGPAGQPSSLMEDRGRTALGGLGRPPPALPCPPVVKGLLRRGRGTEDSGSLACKEPAAYSFSLTGEQLRQQQRKGLRLARSRGKSSVRTSCSPSGSYIGIFLSAEKRDSEAADTAQGLSTVGEMAGTLWSHLLEPDHRGCARPLVFRQ